MTITRVTSNGSHWFLNDSDPIEGGLPTYTRTPKGEGPRQPPWDASAVGLLADLVLHPMITWYVALEYSVIPRLYIVIPTSTHRVSAPLSVDEYERLVLDGRHLDEVIGDDPRYLDGRLITPYEPYIPDP